MAKLADLMEQNRELLASIDAWDNGELGLATNHKHQCSCEQENHTMSHTKRT